jgi:quinol monooxygenase YgiN
VTTHPRCTLTATLHAHPEKRAELIKLLETFVPRSPAEPGCIDYHFHVSEEDENVFYFYENWTSREALNVHLNLPYQKEWFGRHGEFLSRKVELPYFSMLSQYDK